MQPALFFFPNKDDWRQRLIYSLYLWSEEPSAFEIRDFLNKYKLSRALWLSWTEKYDDLAEAYNEVKSTIAARKRCGALTKDLDKDVAFRDMHCYEEDWDKNVNQYWAKMKVMEKQIENLQETLQFASNLMRGTRDE